MQSTLAMAGMAEAAEYYSILLWRGVIGVAVILALWGFVRRSRRIAWTALVTISLSLVLSQPWFIFFDRPVPTDPDAVYWIAKWRVLAVIHIVGSVLCLSLGLGTLIGRSKKPVGLPVPAGKNGI